MYDLGRSIFKLAFITFFVLGINGCSLIYPVYHRPRIPIPKHWSMQSVSMYKPNTLPYLAWWNKFKDPVLNQLIQCGLQENNSVGKARGRIEKAQGELLSVEFGWLPRYATLAGFSQNPNFGSPGNFYGVYPGYFGVNIFNILAGTKSARINIEAQYYMLDATNLVLIGKIASGYYTYLAALEQKKLYLDYIKDIVVLLDIQLQEYQGKINSLISLQETKELLADVRSKLHQTEDNIIKSQNALRYLINQNPGKILAGAQFHNVKTSYTNFASLPATALADRPDVAFAEARYRLAVQNIGVAKSDLLPLIQMDYFYGRTQFTSRGTPLHTPAKFGEAYGNWIIDPTIFGDIKALKGVKKIAYHAYIDSVRKALREVDDAIISHQTANERYEDTNQSYLAAREKERLDNDLFKRGIISYRDLLIDTLVVDNLALRLNTMKLIQILAVVNLYENIGGGYKASICKKLEVKNPSNPHFKAG